MTLEHSDTEQFCGPGQLPTLVIDLDDGSMSPSIDEIGRSTR